MTTTIDLTYNQIRSIVMQMPLNDRLKLSDELDSMYASSVCEELTPYTVDELNARIDEAEADIRAGRIFPAEEMHQRLEAKYPWLCE